MSKSILRVRWSSPSGGGILLGGPPGREDEARALLEQMLYEILDDCLYFNQTQRSAKYAEDLARDATYQVSMKRGATVKLWISLNIGYKNPPGHWKWWARIRTDDVGNVENTRVIGSPMDE